MGETTRTNPVPTRFDEDEMELIEKLASETGLSKSEIIRRSVNFALAAARKDKSVDFLLGDPDRLKDILEASED